MIELTVHGIPAPQGSKGHVGNGRMVESSSKALKPWREAVRGEVQRAIEAGAETIATGPVGVRITFGMPRPKAHYRTGRNAHLLRGDAPTWCAKSPDIDKCLRSTLDALTQGGAYADDRQVAALEVEQVYAEHPATTSILIRSLPEGITR